MRRNIMGPEMSLKRMIAPRRDIKPAPVHNRAFILEISQTLRPARVPCHAIDTGAEKRGSNRPVAVPGLI